MRFHPLDKMINLHDDYTRVFRIDNLKLLLVQRNGERFLIEADCPHRGFPLERGSFADGTIECPGHHYRFSTADGHLIYASEQPCRALRVFTPIYQGNEIGVLLEEHGEQGMV
jgi:nitrite reductase/ring-hydroxylating ferredoxin subunit